MFRAVLCTGLLACLIALPVAGQTCNQEVTAGNFDIEYQGAFFNGTDTEFSYCVTNTGGQALSHWVLTLDAACIDPDNLVSCGPDPCGYIVNDPTTGVTGIKWDNTNIQPGENECFDFALEGDWTSSIGNVTIAMKAGQNVSTGEICGPICVACEAAVEVVSRNGQVRVGTLVRHNRPPTVFRRIEYAILDSSQQVVHRWSTPLLTFNYLDVYKYFGPVPNLQQSLAPGQYIVVMRLGGMSGWHWRTKPFVVN